MIAGAIILGKNYFDGKKANNQEPNPFKWDWSRAFYMVGNNSNLDGSSSTWSLGIGWSPEALPAIGHNNNDGFGVGYWSPDGVNLGYPKKQTTSPEVKVNQEIKEVRQDYGAAWRAQSDGGYRNVTSAFDIQLDKTMAYFAISRDWFDISYPKGGLEKEIDKMMFFRSKVNDNSVFDIKRTSFSRANLGAEYGIYRDQEFRYDDFGNYNYGVAAKYFGLTLDRALLGAGLNQISKLNPDLGNLSGYFDHRRDTEMIKRGYYHKW